MNRFSELQAIDQFVNVAVKLTPVGQPHAPGVRVTLNGDQLQHSAQMITPIELTALVSLLTPIELEIELFGKQYLGGEETAVVVDSVAIDGFEIVPNYTHLVQYTNDHNYTHPTNYIGFNGVWRLMITEPFYRWRHHATGQGWLLEP